MKLTPMSLAVQPSATASTIVQPAYDPKRQYGVSREILKSTPVMTKTSTQTFDSKGKPKDGDQD